MLHKRIVYYVSGHGFGHARRAAAIMQAIVARDPQAEIVVRTTAPAGIFAGMDRVRVDPPAIMLDFGAAELDAMSIDVPATLRNVATLFSRRDEIVAREIAFLRENRITLVCADIPFIIGDVVNAYRRTLGPLPALAAGNFTWDWIYEPYFAANPQYAHFGPAMREAYNHFDAYIRLPLSHEPTCFHRVIDVPLVVHEPELPATEVARRIGVKDNRPRVLLAMRGGMSGELIAKVAAESPHYLFLSLAPVPTGLPENVHHVATPVDFTDLMAACDVAVSKLGYGILADAVACGTRLLWPARQDFREDDIFRPLLPKYVREREIPRDDLRAGRWRTALDAVMQSPAPTGHIDMNGAEVSAKHILNQSR